MTKLRVVLTGLLVGALLILVVPAQADQTQRRSPDASPAAADGDRPPRGDLRGDQVLPPDADADARSARIRTWPGSRITYYESIPDKWDWSLDRALAAWNSAGGRISFVEVASPRRAQLRISYGYTSYADGMATVGYTPGAWVHLSTAYKRVKATNAVTRVWVGRLFAHELGHVLSFGHTPARCSLMVAVFNLSTCPVLGDTPGYYACRWIDKPLLTRFVGLYGGRAHRPPAQCLIDPRPPQLADVTFEGGQDTDSPVTLGWTPPGRVPSGSKVRIKVSAATSCDSVTYWSDTYTALPAAGGWSDPGHGIGSHCYRVQIVNRYGATRPPIFGLVDRWAPDPAAPDLGPLTWSAAEGGFRFSWTRPPDTHLEVLHGPEANPTQCRSTYDGGFADLPWRDAGVWHVWPYHPDECLAFFVVTDWGTVSPATTVVVSVPAPTVQPTVGTVTADPDIDGYFRVTASLPDAAHHLGIEVRPGTCPAVPPQDATYWDAWEISTDRWQLPAEQEGANCAMVAALDQWDRHGPVVMRPFTWTPAP